MPWFVKTEVFKKPREVLEPILEAHQNWIKALQSSGQPILSGFLMSYTKNPGGGLLLFYASNYLEAKVFIQQDPLIANNCVEWELHEWIGPVNMKS